MSVVRQVIEIRPSAFSPKENYLSTNFQCPTCHGEGYVWQAGKSPYEGDEKVVCPKCEGTGLLDAVITVEWRAHK